MTFVRYSKFFRVLTLTCISALVFLWPVFLASGQSSDYYYFGSGIGDDPALGGSNDDDMSGDNEENDDTGTTDDCDFYYVGSGLCDGEGDDEENEDEANDGGSDTPGDCDFYYVGSGLCDGEDGGDGDGTDGDEDMVEMCPLTGTDLSQVINFPPPSGPIVAFGNSLTAGVGASPGEDYVSELEREIAVNIVNEGEPGDTTEDALARLNEDVLDQDPSVVIVWLGGNDELRRIYEQLQSTVGGTALEDELNELVEKFGVEDIEDMPLLTREETFANIETIIEEIQTAGALTILIGFDPALYDLSIADNYEDIAEDTGTIFVPNIYANIFGRPSRMSDLIHPNNAGYDIIADRIEPALRCALPNR